MRLGGTLKTAVAGFISRLFVRLPHLCVSLPSLDVHGRGLDCHGRSVSEQTFETVEVSSSVRFVLTDAFSQCAVTLRMLATGRNLMVGQLENDRPGDTKGAPSSTNARVAKSVPFAERLSCTIEEACEVTGLGRTKVYELIGSGQLVTATIGRRRLVMVRSLVALLSTTRSV